jgi:predicted permease
LIVGAGLLIQSLRQIQSTPTGFATHNVLLSGVDLLSAGYNAERAKAFQDQLLDRVRRLPGVQAVAFARVIPFGLRDFSSAPIAVEGYQTQPEEQPMADYNQVGPEYFGVMGIPIVAGREFSRDDNETRPLVAIVDETMAAKYWPERNALGARFQVKNQWLEVVGIAKSSHYRSKLETAKPFFYVPLRQNFAVQGGLLIRTNQTVATMTPALAHEVHALDPNLAPVAAITMQEHVDRGTYTQRLAVTLLGMFGGMALLLAAIGLYAVMSYSVSQRTRELALRMALGARVVDLLRLVMSRGLLVTAGGLVIGVAAALVLTRQFQNRLYQVSPHDPVAFGGAVLLMMGVALISCLLPACRVVRIDPADALRA